MRTQIEIPSLHPSQQDIYNHRQRFTVLACGRRFGKTHFFRRLALDYILTGKRVGLFYPTRSDATELWELLCDDLAPVTRKLNLSDRRLHTFKGGFLRVWSIGSMAKNRGRGTYLHLALIDEAAYVPDETPWTKVIRPLLTDKVGEAVFGSSPNGMNWFWDLYKRGISDDPADADWISYNLPSSKNPLMPPEEIEAARRDMPENAFLQEYMAEFIPDTGTVFRKVSDVSLLNMDAQAYDPTHEYVMGVDWGRDNDYTALSVMDATTGHQVYRESFNKIGWAVQRERIVQAQAVWNCRVIWAEVNSIGSPNIEALQADGLPVRPFSTTSKSKAPLIEALVLAIEQAAAAIDKGETPKLLLLRDKLQMLELQAYNAIKLPGGGIRYAAQAGKHDDTVIALALSLYAMEHGQARISFW